MDRFDFLKKSACATHIQPVSADILPLLSSFALAWKPDQDVPVCAPSSPEPHPFRAEQMLRRGPEQQNRQSPNACIFTQVAERTVEGGKCRIKRI